MLLANRTAHKGFFLGSCGNHRTDKYQNHVADVTLECKHLCWSLWLLLKTFCFIFHKGPLCHRKSWSLFWKASCFALGLFKSNNINILGVYLVRKCQIPSSWPCTGSKGTKHPANQMEFCPWGQKPWDTTWICPGPLGWRSCVPEILSASAILSWVVDLHICV